jgi:hypothetical protein
MLYYSVELPDIEFNIRVPEPSRPIGLPATYFFLSDMSSNNLRCQFL